MPTFRASIAPDQRPSALVIGAGVSGLTSALCLARRGIRVTVLAERFSQEVTSVVAGALWEWPPAICGHHRDEESLERAKEWCEVSYSSFASLAADRATGVFFRRATFYFRHPIDEDQYLKRKVIELKSKVKGFRHDPALLRENGVNAAFGLRDAYSHLAPMVDTDAYMAWLDTEVRAAGCRFVARRLSGSLREQESELLREHRVDAIIHCAGLGAAELANDSVTPLRGALVRVRNDGKAMPRITQAHCVPNDGPGFVFIVPRGEDFVVLGGFAEPDQHELNIGLHNHPPIREAYQRCLELLPALKNAPLDEAEPVRVGLRPYRERNVRLELEPGTRILHNYGHGGSGVSLSWGCATEVADLFEKHFSA